MSSIASEPLTSVVCPTCGLMFWPPVVAPPLSFMPVWLLLRNAASSSARSAPVAAPASEPIICVMPMGMPPRHGQNGHSIRKSRRFWFSSPSSQLR